MSKKPVRAPVKHAGATAAAYEELLASAHAAADASGAVLRSRFRRRIAIDNKAAAGTVGARAFDPVTAADKAAERAITKVLKARHPDHGLLGEEYGAARPDARYQWVIDPIDGTRAFIVGMPTWGTLIGLNTDGVPLLGLMDQPYTGERAWADRTRSHWRSIDGGVTRMRTRACGDLAQALAMTTTPDLFKAGSERAAIDDIRASARMVRYGGDCYSYSMLAAGHVDIVLEAGLEAYDIVAMIPIIERAGGRVTTWTGAPAAAGGQVLATGDPRLHDTLLERFRKLGIKGA